MSEQKFLRIMDYDVVGFDIDHTLAKYNVPHLFDSISASFSSYLVREKGYDKSILQPFELDKDFCTRGVVLDVDHGNFLKLAEDGTVLRASHGTHFLTEEEILAEYGKDRHWSEFEQLIDEVNNLGDRYRVFENFFDMPFMVVSARIVDLIDKQNGRRQDKYTFWGDVHEAAGYTYTHTQFAAHQGGFFPLFKEETDKFLQPATDSVKTWLKALRQNKKKLFVLTSSFNDFALHTLNFVLGSDWQDYFDLVCTFARKPGFFIKDRPFLEVVSGEEGRSTEKLGNDLLYSQGNPKDLMKYLTAVTGQASPKVLFVGDSLRSDIFPAKQHGKWDTLLILEEMVLEQHTKVPVVGDVERQNLAEPAEKEKDYLTSAHWGSFFTDRHPQGTFNAVSKDGRKRMNTLWGHIVRKYADVAIPQLDYITEFPLEHKFEVFDHTTSFKWGFYPFLPSALVEVLDQESN